MFWYVVSGREKMRGKISEKDTFLESFLFKKKTFILAEILAEFSFEV